MSLISYTSRATLAKYPELDESSAFRLEALQSIQEWLEDPKNDEPKQLGNVKALIDAYRSKNLTWNEGLVTYWINGVQRSQPRPFQLEEFWYLGREHGYTSFWVEGVSSVSKLTRIHIKITIIIIIIIVGGNLDQRPGLTDNGPCSGGDKSFYLHTHQHQFWRGICMDFHLVFLSFQGSSISSIDS